MSQLEEIKARAEGHTPGPWHVYADTDEAYGVQSSGGPLTWDDHGGDVFRNRADAELIAAAPKLLAALEAVEAYASNLECSALADYQSIAHHVQAIITEALQ